MSTRRDHCDACGWDSDDSMLSEQQGEGGGVLWTLRVCSACGEEVYQTVLMPREEST